jgi:hypothetical protein
MSNTVHDNNDVRLQGRTHRTKPDVNWVGGTTLSPNSLREMGAWKVAIIHAETNHTFASAKTFPGHSLKKDV